MEVSELLRQIRDDNSERAFKALFECQYNRMFRIAYYFLQNDDLAKEVTLDVLADIWEKRKTSLIPTDFNHYSFVIIRNAAVNLLKKEGRYTDDNSDAALSAENESYASPHELIEQSELFEKYEYLVSKLPEKCRLVFQLVKEDGMSYAEVAEQLQISVKTVDAHLQKALHFLRENLASYLGKEYGKRFFSIFL